MFSSDTCMVQFITKYVATHEPKNIVHFVNAVEGFLIVYSYQLTPGFMTDSGNVGFMTESLTLETRIAGTNLSKPQHCSTVYSGESVTLNNLLPDDI